MDGQGETRDESERASLHVCQSSTSLLPVWITAAFSCNHPHPGKPSGACLLLRAISDMASTSIDANLLSPASPSIPLQSAGPSISLSSATYPSQALAALETYKKKDASKVVVRFKAIGNAPIMKNNYFRITAFNRFQAVIQFLRKELSWKQGDALVRMG